ncbi:MAG: GntR family transcriptional regulator, partial [Leuconostoc falkenbergense]
MAKPRYIEIHNQILSRIEAGEWEAQKRLPAERDLALEFDVSRMTLRQAIQTLVD